MPFPPLLLNTLAHTQTTQRLALFVSFESSKGRKLRPAASILLSTAKLGKAKAYIWKSWVCYEAFLCFVSEWLETWPSFIPGITANVWPPRLLVFLYLRLRSSVKSCGVPCDAQIWTYPISDWIKSSQCSQGLITKKKRSFHKCTV